MPDNPLVAQAKEFAVETVRLCIKIRERSKAKTIIDQLLRSGTGIGVKILEASHAQDRAGAVGSYQAAIGECDETAYWLEVFFRAGIIPDKDFRNMFSGCGRLRRLLTYETDPEKRDPQGTGGSGLTDAVRRPGFGPASGRRPENGPRRYCPICGYEIPLHMEQCPICGKQLSERNIPVLYGCPMSRELAQHAPVKTVEVTDDVP